MKIILIPDSFKGTLSSREVIEIEKRVLLSSFPVAEIVGIEAADGGEGTVRAVINAAGGKLRKCRCVGPYFEEMEAEYGITDGGRTAVIEVASCIGLPLVKGRSNPALATSFGVGEQILECISRGIDNIVVGLGGSCSNDGGCGLASALGVRFYDANDEQFIPAGATLAEISRIDISSLKIDADKTRITAMCDIDNPLYGPDGAACVFAAQKGADESMVVMLDQGLRHLAEVVKRELNIDINQPGCGAAGGLGGGLLGFFKAELKQGIDVVLDVIDFDRKLRDADLVITGEGKLDQQSLRGKAISGIARRCVKNGVACVAIVGCNELDDETVRKMGLSGVFACNDAGRQIDKKQAIEKLEQAVGRFSETLITGQKADI